MYTFIKNIEDVTMLESSELKALGKLWKERKEQLKTSGEYQEFLKRMSREWAVETGIVERLYTWDRGITELLIEHGIDAHVIAHRGGIHRDEAEHISEIIQDQYRVVDGLFAFVKGDQPLTEHYIRTLHAEFTAHQDHVDGLTPDGRPMRIPLTKGDYKKQPNNPLRQNGLHHDYCPPEHVQQEMEHLVSWYRAGEEQGMAPEVLAAFLHHRFTQIHPFQDGNGRVARALATMVFLRQDLFPLVIRDSSRKDYILALEKADAGDLKPLCDLFARNQRESILSALGIDQSVQQARHVDEILTAGLQLLKNKYKPETGQMDEVFKYAEHLRHVTIERFDVLVQSMKGEWNNNTSYDAFMNHDDSNEQKRQYFRNQIIDMAERYKYFADFSKKCFWASLTIKTINHFQCVVSFHGIGPVHNGIMAASCFTLFRIPREDRMGTDPVDVRPASPDFFQFNYMESKESIERRFKDWLDSALAIALAEWQRSLARVLAS